MWYITFKGQRKYLKPYECVSFGRKNGDINFPDDKSISKKHASIWVIPKNELKIGEPTSLCIVIDLNSKYGTYILHKEKEMLVSMEEYELKNGDKVQLGLHDVVLTVVHVPISMADLLSSQNSALSPTRKRTIIPETIPETQEEGKDDAVIQNYGLNRETCEMLKKLTEIQIIPIKSGTNKKIVTSEASCTSEPKIVIISEISNSSDPPSLQPTTNYNQQSTHNISANENCNEKFTEGSNRNSDANNQNSMSLRKPLGKTFKKVHQKKPRPNT